jgi:hypothetical protein
MTLILADRSAVTGNPVQSAIQLACCEVPGHAAFCGPQLFPGDRAGFKRRFDPLRYDAKEPGVIKCNKTYMPYAPCIRSA